MIATRLGHYTLESCIGQGGMGEVYLATDTRLGRSVAIKVLHPASAGREQSLRRFVQEARTASSLNHPNIVTIHEIGDEGSIPFIVMERIDGEVLSSVLREPMELGRFFDYALQITSALAAAHRAGVVHRDIKPGNIMFTASGVVKVVDFGLARLVLNPVGDADADPEASTATAIARGPLPMTAPGSMIGTVGYMSPEQVQGLPADSRSDVFSTGVVFHEMLSGRPAFRAGSTIVTLSAILRDEPPPLSSVREDVPPALDALVTRCLAKNSADRYANATEMHAELQAIRQSLVPTERKLLRRRPAAVGALLTVMGLLIALGVFWWRRDARTSWVRNEALPEIERLFLAQDTEAAYRLARRAMEISPDDPQLKQMWTNLTVQSTVASDPAGAQIEIKNYAAPDGPWTSLGKTPIHGANVPRAQLRFRISKEGYAPIEVAPSLSETLEFKLNRIGVVEARMVAVSGGPTRFEGRTVEVPDFHIDQFEVTNREYKKFVDAGGYQRPELWKHPIVRDGRTLPWAAAVREMTDSTGRPGPSGWELGSYSEGQGELPVDGVSWYEAAAYAEFAGKRLPSIYHWMRAATDFGLFSDVLTASNFESKGPVGVGTKRGLGPHGTYDMAGNVKEWCSNAVGSQRFALGGAWFEPGYQFLYPDALPPIERRRGFGLRLMKPTAAPLAELNAGVVQTTTAIPAPVDDATFELYARLFDYDPLPLNARVEEIDDSQDSWIREKVSFAAAYGDERVPAYLYLPRNARPPYQIVVFFPGSDARTIKSSKTLWVRLVDFYVKSGRAVVYPVYKGTYERQVQRTGPNAARELRIQQVKDVRRVVDYLATRSDLDSSRLLYHGLSWGVSMAPANLAVERRFKAAVLVSGGYFANSSPELSMQNYLPHVNVPVLLVSGRHDFMAPYETSQKPFFDLLGTPSKDKRHLVLNGGHFPAHYNEMVKEILDWTDTRLGPVQR
jgi:serine/threonine protein kinase/formylglycine-generating enzyme required for sulfatase activity/predicted esterase